MAGPGWLDDVRRIIEHAARSDAHEIDVRRGTFRVRLRREVSTDPARQVEVPRPIPVEADAVAVVAPLTGVFYRAASPGAAPFVADGDLVTPTTVVGLIETMKTYNEVVADRAGRAMRYLVESGQLVHAGDHLLLLRAESGA